MPIFYLLSCPKPTCRLSQDPTALVDGQTYHRSHSVTASGLNAALFLCPCTLFKRGERMSNKLTLSASICLWLGPHSSHHKEVGTWPLWGSAPPVLLNVYPSDVLLKGQWMSKWSKGPFSVSGHTDESLHPYSSLIFSLCFLPCPNYLFCFLSLHKALWEHSSVLSSPS
jgi:hypothetical protein